MRIFHCLLLACLFTAPESFTLLNKATARAPRCDDSSRMYMVQSSASPIEGFAIDKDFRNQVNECRKTKAPKKLMRIVQDYKERGDFDQNMTYFVAKTFQRMNRTDLYADMAHVWFEVVDSLNTWDIDVDSSAVMIRGLARLGSIDSAQKMAVRCGAAAFEDGNVNVVGSRESLSPYELNAYAKIVPVLALSYTLRKEFGKAKDCLEIMKNLDFHMDVDTSRQILKAFLKETNLRDARYCLRNLCILQGLSDNDSLQLITNVMLRDLDFVKGAVSMQTLPEASHPEIAFIGRSNVGKSSLINMFTNRKGLAFTSKTPGKTSEFNYFYSKGRVGKEQSSHEMYIVDLPGVGFADSSRVSSNKRLRWLKLFNDYVTGRPTLKMLCHLVDSRHGLLDSDMDCLKIIPYLPPNVQYTIVLTKADKKDGGVKEGMLARIKRDMNRFVNEAYEAKRAEEASGVETDGDVRNGALSVSNDLDSESTIQTRVVPIVLTSAESREGGPALWSHIMEHVASVSINMESDSADAIISKTGAAAPSAKMFDDKTLAEWTRLQGIEPVIISLGDIHG